MSVDRVTIGWGTTGAGGVRYCPVHRPGAGVELLSITLADAQAAGLSCSVCGEPLARSARPMRDGGSYATSTRYGR